MDFVEKFLRNDDRLSPAFPQRKSRRGNGTETSSRARERRARGNGKNCAAPPELAPATCPARKQSKPRMRDKAAEARVSASSIRGAERGAGAFPRHPRIKAAPAAFPQRGASERRHNLPAYPRFRYARDFRGNADFRARRRPTQARRRLSRRPSRSPAFRRPFRRAWRRSRRRVFPPAFPP